MFDNLRQTAKKIAKAKGMTYAVIAEKAGVEESTIKCFMCGANDSRRIAEKIADVLGIKLIYSNGECLVSQTGDDYLCMIGNRLKQLREERGLNMRQTAQKLEIPYTTYVGYEKNEREPNSEILLKLADFFNCSTDYLLGHTDDPAQIANGEPTKRVKIAVRKSHPQKPRAKKKKHDPARRSRKAILERLKSYRPVKPEVRKEEKDMKEDMENFVHDLGFALMSYSRNGVYRIRYICENGSEYAEISFTDGTKKRVNITGDSCLAATLDITKALI